MEPKLPTASLERSFELSKLLLIIEECNDREKLKTMLKEVTVHNFSQREYYEHLLKSHWGIN